MNIRLLEKNRIELLTKQRQEAPKRVKRANSYVVSNISIDSSAVINDWLILTATISGNGHSYKSNICFKYLISDIIQHAKLDTKHYVNSKLILKSIKNSLDKHDIYIDCSCDDFKFTYSFWSTKDKYKWGRLQSSNGKGIRNPNNSKGSMCKHLFALLRSNNFLNSVSDKIMRIIMANLDIIVNKFNIDLNEFIVNSSRYDQMIKNNNRDNLGRFVNKTEESLNIDNINDDLDNMLLNNFTTEEIIILFKEIINEKDYYVFLKKFIKTDSNKSLEHNIFENTSVNDLLKFIKDYNSKIYETLITSMYNIIF